MPPKEHKKASVYDEFIKYKLLNLNLNTGQLGLTSNGCVQFDKGFILGLYFLFFIHNNSFLSLI